MNAIGELDRYEETTQDAIRHEALKDFGASVKQCVENYNVLGEMGVCDVWQHFSKELESLGLAPFGSWAAMKNPTGKSSIPYGDKYLLNP
jgi:hypothetical protein